MADCQRNAPCKDFRVLILEDNPSDAELLAYELSQSELAFTSELVDNKKSYIQAIRTFRPDIILSDYDLPGFSGWEALEIRKKLCSEIPFILVTGAIGEERAIEVLTGGATDYILKQNLSRLVPAIRRALHDADQQRKRRKAELERDTLLKELERRVHERTQALESEIEGRKRIEKTLRENEERFRSVLESSKDILYRVDLKTGRYDYVSPSSKEIFGYSPDQMTSLQSRTTWALVHPDDLPSLKERFERLLETGKEYIEFRLMNQGRYRMVSIHMALSRDSSGHPLYRTGIMQDITERKEAEDILRGSEEKYRSLFEAMDEGYALCELLRDDKGKAIDYRVLEINPAFEKNTGLTPAEVVGRLRSELNPIRDKRFLAACARVVETGEPNRSEQYNRRLGRWFSVGVFPRGGDTFAELFRDITFRKQAEQSLKRSEEEYRLLVQHAPAGICEIDYAGPSFKRVNDAMCRILGYSREELLEMNPVEIMGEQSRRLFRRRMSQRLEGEEIDPAVSYRIIARDGREIYVILNMTPLYDEDGKPAGSLVVAHDVTKIRKAEEEREILISRLEEANRELESFTYSVSHDLRAPVRAIDGFSSILAKSLDRKLDDEERRRLDLIRENAKRMNHLIDDLLSLSRIGRTELRRETVNMKSLAKSVWKQLMEANPAMAADLKVGALPNALGDESLLWQVFSNLLSNSVKYTRKRKKASIEIGGESKRGESTFRVKDNGVGFSMKQYDRLFGVFQRLHSESEYEGTGVGLAIVQRIIHRHGGRVWAEGRPGRGAVFYFSLPNR